MNLIQETKELLQDMRGSLIQVAQNLHQIHESKEWEQYGSWGEFVEGEFQISQGMASKLLTITRHYLLAGVSQDKLVGIDHECLYLAAKTEGTPEQQAEKARTLTRRELREEQNEKEPHEHEPISICKKCSLRL